MFAKSLRLENSETYLIYWQSGLWGSLVRHLWYEKEDCAQDIVLVRYTGAGSQFQVCVARVCFGCVNFGLSYLA